MKSVILEVARHWVPPGRGRLSSPALSEHTDIQLWSHLWHLCYPGPLTLLQKNQIPHTFVGTWGPINFILLL